MAIELSDFSPTPSAKEASNTSISRDRWKRIKNRDRINFFERLALLLETGSSLHAALQSLRDLTDNRKMSRIIQEMADDVLAGESFSQALGHHPQVFSSIHRNLTMAGEIGGFLPLVLEQLREMEEKREHLKNTIKTAFLYPCFLIVFSTIIVLFIMLVVFPKFGDIFTGIRDQLPYSTIVFLEMSNILRHYWPAFLFGSVLSVFIIRKWRRTQGGRLFIDKFKIKAPGLGTIIVETYLILFLRAMGLALANGVSLLDALQACREMIDNKLFKSFVIRLEKFVGDGRGLAQGFEDTSFIPSMAKQTIRTGEESGNLPRVLNRIADYYTEELERRLSMTAKILEPVMLLIMGLVVGIIVSSLILPIFKLSRTVR